VEPLEDRWNPEVYIWSPLPGSTDATVAANWLVSGDRASTLPGQYDDVRFVDTGGGGADCTNFGAAGTYYAIRLDQGYTGTVSGSGAIAVDLLGVRTGSLAFDGSVEVGYLDVWGGAYAELGEVTAEEVSVLGGALVLNGPMTAEQLSVSGGVIDQGSGSASVTVTGPAASPYAAAFVWTGGTVNSTTNPADLILSGSAATGLIAPANAGTVYLGSTLSLINGAVATMLAGTIEAANGATFDIGEDSGLEVDPGQGGDSRYEADLFDTFHGQHSIAPRGYLRVLTGTYQSKLPLKSWGELTLMSGTTAVFSGRVDDQAGGPSYRQMVGLTRLYPDATLETVNGVRIDGGKLATVTGQDGDTSTVKGFLVVDYGNVVIGDGSYPHQYGILLVDGDVVWNGGTYRPVVDGETNGGDADLWHATKEFTIGSNPGPQLAPGAIDGEGEEMERPTQANWRWLVMQADEAIVGNPNPTVVGPWVNDPDPGPPKKFWYIKST
jgi:hypothetical protein